MEDLQNTFGRQLEQFALAVDIVDETTFNDVWSLIENYLSSHLNIDYFALLRPEVTDGEPGLRADRKTGGGNPSFKLEKEGEKEGEKIPNGIRAYAYTKSKRLWVVGEDEGLLDKAGTNSDLWSGAEGLPAFALHSDGETRTAILVPLKDDNRVFALMDLESSRYLEITEIATKELGLIAETIGKVLLQRTLSTSQRRNTKRAIENLGTILNAGGWPQLVKPEKPKLFLASPGKGDPAVLGVITNVLDEFRDHVDVIYWKNISDSGDINQQVLRAITSAKFGICYFSEEVADDADPPYQDNANVVFEAGMLQALKNTPTGEPIGWIPIREASSPKIPFDFAAQRILVVPRIGEKQLNKDALIAAVKERVEKLLEV